MTVHELVTRMSSSEYRDWQEFYRTEPWGSEVEDYRASTLINTVRASVGGKVVEQHMLFPWSKHLYDEAIASAKRKAADTAHLEASLDRFFDTHNERAGTTTG